MSSGRRTAAVLTLTLSAPDMQDTARIGTDRIPPPTVSGMKTLRAVRATTSAMMSRASLDAVISRNTSSSARLLVVAVGQFDGIAGIAQVDEVDALDDAAGGDVQAGNNSFGKHRLQLHEILNDLQADGAGFLGVELHAVDVACSSAAVYGSVYVRGRRSRLGHRHVVAVREVYMRLREPGRSAAGRAW